MCNTYYNDVIMSAMASQITGVSIVYSTVCASAGHRNYQCSASLAFVSGIHRSPVDSTHKGSVKRKIFPFHDVIMKLPTLIFDSSHSMLCRACWAVVASLWKIMMYASEMMMVNNIILFSSNLIKCTESKRIWEAGTASEHLYQIFCLVMCASISGVFNSTDLHNQNITCWGRFNIKMTSC